MRTAPPWTAGVLLPANSRSRKLWRAIVDRAFGGLSAFELKDRLRAGLWKLRTVAYGQPTPAWNHRDEACHQGRPLRILVVDDCVPRPDHDSGSARMYNLLCAARRVGFQVTFVAHTALPCQNRYVEGLERAGIEMARPPWSVSPAHELRERGARYDVIVLSRAEIATLYATAVRRRAPQARLVFDTVDLHFVRERREAEVLGDPRKLAESERSRRQELWLARFADDTIVVSETEKQILLRECPLARVWVVSNIHELELTSTPVRDRNDMVFIGSFRHSPNVDAVHHFVHTVWPHVRERLPQARCIIIGADPPPSIRALASDRVVVTGHVPDIKPLFETARLSVVPLRYGAGVKGKVNTSMSHGVPVVSTTIGVEGMNLTTGEDVLVADDDSGFAEAIVRLYQDDQLWHTLVQGGIRSIRRTFSFEAAEAVLQTLRDEVHARPRGLESRP